MDDKELETLAEELETIYNEADALGNSWAGHKPAWRAVAKYVAQRMAALVDVSLDLGRLMGTPDHR